MSDFLRPREKRRKRQHHIATYLVAYSWPLIAPVPKYVHGYLFFFDVRRISRDKNIDISSLSSCFLMPSIFFGHR
jgi:hypothetical protein